MKRKNDYTKDVSKSSLMLTGTIANVWLLLTKNNIIGIAQESILKNNSPPPPPQKKKVRFGLYFLKPRFELKDSEPYEAVLIIIVVNYLSVKDYDVKIHRPRTILTALSHPSEKGLKRL